ncbi:MAG: TetR/AcrR family transcriptional regulator [Planctomycetota bacterium]|jgi:TetR/AcrR family fatty acid metabolism transcriptional regulator
MSPDEHLEQRRREILQAAEKQFDANGYSATTMEAIAGSAGISKGSIYNYFSSKHDLFMELFGNYCANSEADFERRLKQPISATQKLHQMLDYWFAMLGQHTRIGSLVLEYWSAAARQKKRGGFSEWFSEKYSEWTEKLSGVIAEGIERGEFREGLDPRVAARLIHAILDGITIRGILDQNTKVDADFLESMKQAILTGLTAEPIRQEEQ